MIIQKLRIGAGRGSPHRLVRSFSSHEVDERLNAIGHDFAAITRVVVDVLWQEMPEVFAEPLELAPANKVALELRCISAEVLNVGDVCSVSGLCIISTDPLDISKPSAEKPAQVVATLDAPATQGKPISDDCGQDARGKHSIEER